MGSFRDDSDFRGTMGRKKRRFDRDISKKINILFRIAASSFPYKPKKPVIPNPPAGG
jgi:hypothetical protein